MNQWSLERSCEIQVACDSIGKNIIPVGDEVLARSEQLMAMQAQGQPSGELEFKAFTRIIDKIDNSYKV
jgi:hypothetical protein